MVYRELTAVFWYEAAVLTKVAFKESPWPFNSKLTPLIGMTTAVVHYSAITDHTALTYL
jgi:hypothetical protein